MPPVERTARICLGVLVAVIVSSDVAPMWRFMPMSMQSTAVAPEQKRIAALVEAPRCYGSPSPAQTSSSPVPSPPPPPGGTRITFTIPPTTFAKTSTDGAIESVATNTGCAPRSTDVFVHLPPEGHPQDERLFDRVLLLKFTGDWTSPGEWHQAA